MTGAWRRVRVPSALSTLGMLSAACGPHDRELAYYERGSEPPVVPSPVPSSSIDANRRVDAERPGEHTAAFLEYERGGSWFLGVTCDFAASRDGCEWDIIVATLDGAPIFRVLASSLERSDVVLIDLAAARLVSYTTDDLDGVSFRAGEGGGLRVDVLLDGTPHPELARWVGGGALHLGAPANPFDLVPDPP